MFSLIIGPPVKEHRKPVQVLDTYETITEAQPFTGVLAVAPEAARVFVENSLILDVICVGLAATGEFVIREALGAGRDDGGNAFPACARSPENHEVASII